MEKVTEKLKEIIRDLFGNTSVEFALTPAPKDTEADYSTNVAMLLARELHKNPMEIATEIAKVYEQSSEMEKFPLEIATPGFLNFSTPDEYFIEKIADFGKNFTKNIACDNYAGQTVICEFSDPNPFKVLHVGHLYTSIVGDSISRLVEFAGGKVVRANFGGDVGLHVGKTIWALEREGVAAESLTIEKIAECYVKGTQAYEDDETAHNEITNLNKEIYQIAAASEKDETETEKLYWTGRKLSYQYFADFYAKLGVKFDVYYPESEVAERGLETVREELAAGVYEESDGAVVFRGEKYGLHTRVFINQNGLPTYETKDVGLLLKKWDDYKFDRSIVITGNDIIDYMKVVLKSVEQYRPDLVEKTLHITHGNVRLPGNEKMSSRKGNFIRAVDVLDSVNVALDRAYGEGQGNVDSQIMLASVKYAFLKYKIGGNIEFDVDSSVSMTGNSGPYLQYSAVRAKKILANTMKNGVASANPESGAWQLEDHERTLIKKIIEYKDVLEMAVNELAPNKVCAYLYELSQEFSRFYENVQVAGSAFEFERGQIVLAYLKVMMHGLGLMGIEVPEKM